jgi:divalent metal cation (Fe/Co/Zn/Cd) transporter
VDLDQVPGRAGMVARALWLVTVSVVFGVVSGVVSVVSGLSGHSLGVFAVGLDVLADVTGSAALIWRFRAERRRPGHAGRHEKRVAVIVAVVLAVVSVVLAAQSVIALASGSRPGTSPVTLIAAGVSLAVLTPLARAKRRLGRQMNSPALQGDGALSGIGAATSLLALAGLGFYEALGWWWADRIAALIVAAAAAAAAWHTAPGRPRRAYAAATPTPSSSPSPPPSSPGQSAHPTARNGSAPRSSRLWKRLRSPRKSF